MNDVKRQQIIISGVGGQGVLFITKLLAETALETGYSVLISETHGMAQRGGIVVSHLKVCKPVTEEQKAGHKDGGVETGNTEGSPTGPSRGVHINACFVSPLIRPGHADILLAVHSDALLAHAFFLKKGGRVYCNAAGQKKESSIDASRLAAQLGSPISANLALLGYAVGSGSFFCQPRDLIRTLERMGGARMETSLKVLKAGLEKGRKAQNGADIA